MKTTPIWQAGAMAAALLLGAPPPASAQPRQLDWSGFADDEVAPPSKAPEAPPAPRPAGPRVRAEFKTEPKAESQAQTQAQAQAEAHSPEPAEIAAEDAITPDPEEAIDPEAAQPPGPQSGATHDLLQQLVTKALALSPEVREAAARWQASEFDIDELRGQRWPQLQLGVASPSATFGSGANDAARRAIGSLQLTTPIYDWGRISSSIESSSESAKAAREQLRQARQQVAFDTLRALIELHRQGESLAFADAYVARMGELVQMLEQIVASDRGRESELVQARARRLQAIAARDQTGARLAEVEIDLLKLTGDKVELPPQFRWEPAPAELQQALLAASEHPSLRQARAEARSAELHAQSMRAALLPQLNWVIAKTTQEDSLGIRQPWATGLALQWNLFQGGSAQAAEKAAFGRALASEEKALAATQDLEYRLRSSAQRRDSALRLAEDYGALIADSDRVRQMFYEQWHQLGTRSLLDVLIAESDFQNHRIAEVNARHDGAAADLRIRADAALLLPWLFGGEEPTG